MEAFDVIHALCEYHNYAPGDAEPAYHCLLQTESLALYTDSCQIGFLCFYAMHDAKVADLIQDKTSDISRLIGQITKTSKKPMPEDLLGMLYRAWAA